MPVTQPSEILQDTVDQLSGTVGGGHLSIQRIDREDRRLSPPPQAKPLTARIKASLRAAPVVGGGRPEPLRTRRGFGEFLVARCALMPRCSSRLIGSSVMSAHLHGVCYRVHHISVTRNARQATTSTVVIPSLESRTATQSFHVLYIAWSFQPLDCRWVGGSNAFSSWCRLAEVVTLSPVLPPHLQQRY